MLATVSCSTDPYEAAAGAHAICVLTEWDEFKTYDYKKMFDSMVRDDGAVKPFSVCGWRCTDAGVRDVQAVCRCIHLEVAAALVACISACQACEGALARDAKAPASR